MSYSWSMITLKIYSFPLYFTTFTTPSQLLEVWLGKGLELMLGVSSKVIHHALNKCKSFNLNAKQVSMLRPWFLAWYSHVRSSLYQLGKEGLNREKWRGATWLMFNNFAYISPMGIGKGRSCSWFLWYVLFGLFSAWFFNGLVGWFTGKSLAKLILSILGDGAW